MTAYVTYDASTALGKLAAEAVDPILEGKAKLDRALAVANALILGRERAGGHGRARSRVRHRPRPGRPQLAAIRARLNIGTAALLAVGAWTLAGPDGLRQLGHAITGRGGLGFDGALALAGVLISLVPPLFRILFLRGAPHGQPWPD